MATSIGALLSEALAKLNITNYTFVINNSGKGSGDGYSGETYKVKVKHQHGEIDLFVKQATESEQHRNFLYTEKIYKNEIGFYTSVFPVLDKFQKDKNVKNPFQITKCYATSLENRAELLVLEDLVAAGYKPCDRKKPLDEFHVSLVLRSYGKFHALSLALHDQHPELFKQITGNLTDLFPLVFPTLLASMKMQVIKNLQMLIENGYTAEFQLAEKVTKELEGTLVMNSESDDPYNVVTHGDCWCNNMMFKYDVRVFCICKIFLTIYLLGKQRKTRRYALV